MKLAFLSATALLFSGALAIPGNANVTEIGAKALCGNPFRHFGVSEAGAENNNNRIPGTLGNDYAWPTATSADFFLTKGFNTIRIPFLMERLANYGGLRGNFDTTYFQTLKGAVQYVTSKGAYAILDAHNFNRYNNSRISNQGDFQNFWNRLANEFRYDGRVIFEVQNAPNEGDANSVFDLANAAIQGIRQAGANQLIIVEGSNRSWAAGWQTNRNSANRIRDPNNNFAFGLRTYFDRDGSGQQQDCYSTSIGTDRIRDVTDWLKNNGKQGFLVEFGAGPSGTCINAIASMLCTMQQSGVWIGATYWAAGPMWGNNFGSIEPPNGPAVAGILPQALQPFI